MFNQNSTSEFNVSIVSYQISCILVCRYMNSRCGVAYGTEVGRWPLSKSYIDGLGLAIRYRPINEINMHLVGY